MASLRIATFFVVIFLIANTRADKCNAGCHGASTSKRGFLEGQAYSYSLEGISTINLTGADNQDTQVKLSAQATVYGLGNCANILKVTSVTITGKDGTKYSEPSDISLPVRFTLQDGVLGSEMCAEKGDSQKSLNIKRAIISLLQAATKNAQEVDVFGVCPTNYHVSNEGEGQIVTKEKDLSMCANREQAKQDLLTYISNPDSEVKNSNIMKSQMRSTIVFKNGIVEKVEVHEDYLYKPFSVGNNGVKGNVNTRFVLRNVNKGSITASCVVPKSVIFENPHLVNTDHSNVNNIMNALKVATSAVKDYVKENSASKFIALVRAMRVSSKNDLKNVYSQCKDKVMKKVFMDGLFRAGTGDAIEFATSLLQEKKLNKLEEKLLLASLSNVRHATSGSIKSALALLENKDLSLDAYLGVGALAGSYCKEHKCHGAEHKDAGVNALFAKFAAKLGDCKCATRKDENLKVAVLKGVKNVGHIEENFIDKLAHCAADKNVKPRVRVAALEAFFADPCYPKLQEEAVKIMKDRQQDSEVRIKAYLALVQCPNKMVAKEVSALMEHEPVYQVGSFITSSLYNIRASTNPAKAAAKHFLGDITPKKTYPLNIAKFSRNYELSYEMNSVGLGSSAEANVIFSQDSYIPRSANLNLTYEIFGRQINFFELGVRQGNLDRVFEEYFGPQSALFTDSPQQLYSEFKKTLQSISEKFDERTKTYRSKRDVMKQIADLGKKMKTNVQGYNGNLDLDLTVKLFGVESVFLSLGDDQPHSFEALVDKAFDFFDARVDEVKNFNYDVNTNLVFLDMELAYPTSTGLTMKLNLEGAMSSKVSCSGNFDIKKMFHDPKNSKFEVKVVPSANVEVVGSLSFDADSVVHGLKTVMSLRTSTGSHVVFKTSENGFDVQFGFPVEKQELVTASSDVFFFKREKGAQDVDNKVKFERHNWVPYTHACFDQLSSSLGLNLCIDMSIPKVWDKDNKKDLKLPKMPMFPLSGNALFSVRLEKENLNAYHIKGNKVNRNGVTTMDLDFSVEGTKAKKGSINLEMSRSPTLFQTKAKFDFDIKKLEGLFALKTADDEYSLDAYVLHDSDKYGVKFGIVRPEKNTYKPVFEYQMGGNKEKGITVGGTIKYEQSGDKKKYVFNGVNVNFAKNVYSVNGFLALSPKPFTCEMDLKFNNGVVKGNLVHTEENTKGFFEMQNVVPTNVRVELNSVNKENEEKFDFSFIHGDNLQNGKNKFTFTSQCKGVHTPPDYSYKAKMSYPLYDVSGEFELEHHPKHFGIEFETQYMKQKAEFELELKRAMTKEKDLYGKLKAFAMDTGVELEGRFDEQPNNKGHFFVKANLKPQGKYEVTGDVIYRDQPNDQEYGVVATYKHGGKSDYKLDMNSKITDNTLVFYEKLFVGPVAYVDVAFDVTADKPAGNMKVILKDIVNAQGKYKINDDNNGNVLAIVDFSKWDRQLKLESSFTFQAPTYTLDFSFFPNFKKDQKKKITFTTNNVFNENNLRSKNTLDVFGEKNSVNFGGEYTGTFENGNSKGDIEFIFQDGKKFTMNFARDIQMNNDNLKGSMDVNSVYTPATGQNPFKGSWKGRISNTNKGFESEHQFNLVSDKGETLDMKIGGSRVPKKDRAQADIKFDLSGSMCNNPLKVATSFDYYDGEDDQFDIKYKMTGNYGDKTSLEHVGEFFFDIQDEKDSKLMNNFEITLALPLEKPFNLKLSSKDSLIIPDEDDKFFDYSTSKAAQVNGRWYKYDGLAKSNDDNGHLKLSAQVPDHHKVIFDSSYKVEELKDSSVKYQHILSLTYGDNKNFKVAVDSHRHQDKEGQMNIVTDLPAGYDVKKVITNINYKTPAHRTLIGDLKVDIDGKKYTLGSNVNMANKDDSTIEFKASYPNSKPARVYIHAFKTDVNQYKGESKFENLGDFNMELNVDAKLKAPETFDIKVYVDSEKLKLNKVNFEAATDIGNAKKIQFSATENGKNVLSGVTNFQSHQDGNKYMMEGSGTVTIKNEQKSTSFKYIRDKLTEETEKGYETFFNVAFGQKKIVIEHKQTNKEYKLSSVYCEENQQCANIDINNKLDTAPGKMLHNMEFNFDLRKLGFTPEFGLSTSTDVEKNKMPVHALDIHMRLDKFKYHAQVSGKPDSKNKNYVTSTNLVTPNRVVSLDTTTSILEYSPSLFPIQHETVFFFNKNDPKTKTVFRVSHDVKREEHKFVSTVSEALFSSPSIGKDLKVSAKTHYDAKTHEVSYNAVVDLFKSESQKITGELKFHPQIVKNDDIWKYKVLYTLTGHMDAKVFGYEANANEKFSLSADGLELSSFVGSVINKQKKDISLALVLNKHKQSFNFKIPNRELINFQCQCTHGDGSYKADSTLTLFQDKTISTVTELTWRPTYQLSVTQTNKIKDHPEELHFFVKTDVSKKFEFGSKFSDGKAKDNLISFTADLDAKPKVNWKFNSDAVKQTVDKFSQNCDIISKKATETMKEYTDAISKDYAKMNEMGFKNAPNLNEYIKLYKMELEKMVEELRKDKSMASFIDSVGEVILAVNKVFLEVSQKCLEFMGSVNEGIMDTFHKVTEYFANLPKMDKNISEAIAKITEIVKSFVTQFTSVVSGFLDKFLDDFKPMISEALEVVKKLMTDMDAQLDDVRKMVMEVLNSAKNQISEMPFMKMLKETLEQNNIPATVRNLVREFFEQLKAISSTDEMRIFLDAITTYLDKLIKGEKVNDIEQLKNIYVKGVNAYNSLVGKMDMNVPQLDVSEDSYLSFFDFKNMPSFVPPEFSFVNHLLNGNIPDPVELLKAYMPRSIYPTDLIPPYKLQAIVAGGQHIFTYDGRHLTFPGTCKYVLSQDAVDGNFSVVLNMENGAAKSIILWDKSGDEVEVDATHLLVKGQKHGFPLIKSNIQAFRHGDHFDISSKYGVEIKCSNNLDLCYIETSGFYFGKLRGLLGDGNNEPFDDFRIPNGKISNNVGEFGNSYSLSKCPMPEIMDHTFHEAGHAKHVESSMCVDAFGSKSELAIGSIAVDIENYKQACEHAVMKKGKNVKEEVCLIARAYQLACRKSSLFLDLPELCMQCTLGDTTLEYEQEVPLKLPQKQLDLVVSVETTMANENTFKQLAMPIMSAIVDEMKTKNVKDINVKLFGINSKFSSPIQYDIDNPKMNGNKMVFDSVDRNSDWKSPVHFDNEKQDNAMEQFAKYLNEFMREFGLNNFHVSYIRLNMAMNWRPKAVKAWLMFHSEPYRSSSYIQFFQMAKEAVHDLRVPIHVFNPLADLKAAGAKDNSVIGFDNTNVFVLGDQSRGRSHSDMRASIKHEMDFAADKALGSQGSVFSTKTFFALNGGERKSYITLAAQTIVDSLLEVEQEVVCKCENSLLTSNPYVKCETVNVKDKRSKK